MLKRVSKAILAGQPFPPEAGERDIVLGFASALNEVQEQIANASGVAAQKFLRSRLSYVHARRLNWLKRNGVRT